MAKPVTPLRYPGGKQKLTPLIRQVLEANNLIGAEYAEPYAGGSGVALDLLTSGDVRRIHLNDSSFAVFAFWKALLEDTEKFCKRTADATLTIEEWKRQREVLKDPKNHELFEVGFATFYLNRCNRSGILSGGVIGGLAQAGDWKMDARFYRNELIRRITLIGKHSDLIMLENLDAEVFVRDYVSFLPPRTLVYCDPPYYHKAERLYPNYYRPEDHKRIASLIKYELNHPWIVSYDDVAPIRKFYRDVRIARYRLAYSAFRRALGSELIAFSNDLIIPSVLQKSESKRAVFAG